MPDEFLDRLNVGEQTERWRTLSVTPRRVLLVVEDLDGSIPGFCDLIPSRDVDAKSTTAEISAIYGIVAWDSIFHIPKAQHGKLFQTMHRCLRPGAPLLLSLGGSEDEFTAPMFDVDFFYSGHSPEISVALLQEAGFDILLSEVDDLTSGGHVAILCRKPANPMLSTGARDKPRAD